MQERRASQDIVNNYAQNVTASTRNTDVHSETLVCFRMFVQTVFFLPASCC